MTLTSWKSKVALGAFFLGGFLIQFSKSVEAASSIGAIQDTSDMGFVAAPPPEEESGTLLPGGYVRVGGHYRLAGGIDQDQDFIINESDANQSLFALQGPNFRYLFGERLENTYDPGIYSQHLLNIEFSPADKLSFFTQIVNDPWSYVGTTGEQVQPTDTGGGTDTIRYNLKFFGNMGATLPEFYRATDSDYFNFPRIKVVDGQTSRARVVGILPGPVLPTDRTEVMLPRLDIDAEYRPIRKLWMDYEEDEWHARVFVFADETQAMTTDDPLELSNHKDYWQQSPWLYQYKPIQHFTDIDGIDSIKRGFYSDDLSFVARDSQGNRLVLLRGVSYEADFDRTYLAATVAAPFTPWDNRYFEADNVPGAFRFKRDVTDQFMLGSTYTFRNGLVDDRVADSNQVIAVDGDYAIREGLNLKSEVAFSQREHELRSAENFQVTTHGFAYKGVLENKWEREKGDSTEWFISYTQMDRRFEAPLSRYLDTRDDSFWGTHLNFHTPPDLEPFSLGDGVDVNRSVARFQWKEKRFKERFYNLFDVRNVHKTENTAYLETVLRDEVTYQWTPKLTAKGLFRWRGLPRTTPGVEPSMTDLYFPKDLIDKADFTVINAPVQADQNADQFTYSAGLQYVLNKEWTAEGIFERTNAVPSFPRGLLYDVTKSANDRLDGLLVDHLSVFLYGQSNLKALPPYDYFNIVRGRLIFKPQETLTLTAHGAHNGYDYAQGLDDGVTHLGLSAEFAYGKKWSFFGDYTYSYTVSVPHFIASNYTDEQKRGHHNVYVSADYRLNPTTQLRAEYGVFGIGNGYNSEDASAAYSSSTFTLPTLDTEHLFRASLTGEF